MAGLFSKGVDRGEIKNQPRAAFTAAGFGGTGRKKTPSNGGVLLADCVVKRVLQFGALEFEFVQLLVGGELHVLFDATNFVIELVVLLIHLAEMIVAQTEVTDGFAVFRELADERMMYIHWRLLVNVTVR
jgi:hypothetical protein